MRVLVLTPYLPHRRVGHGGGTAVRDLLAWLARRHEVTAACLIRPGEVDLIPEVSALGVTVQPFSFGARGSAGIARAWMLRDRVAAAGRAAASGFPFYVEKYWTPALASGLRELVQRTRPEVVQIEYLQLSLHCRDLARDISRQRPRLILNTHELGSLPRERRALHAATPLARALAGADAARWRRLQVAACGWADRTLCVTPQDRDLLADMGGVRLSTVPLGMDLEAIRADWDPAPDGCRLLFVGSFGHGPNRSGVQLLLDSIWPLVRAARPDATLDLAGRGSVEFLTGRGNLAAWSDQGVTALGFVDDLGPLFRRCHAFAAPLSEGGGIKIKVLEALARGVPVVTTEVGAEGIATADSGALVVAPADAGFAEALLRVTADRALAARLASGGRRLMEQCFGWAAIADRLTRIYMGEPD